MRLSDKLSGKDNNLNLVRFVAAFAVLVSHSFVLATGDFSGEPLRASLGMSLGEIAVDIFFAASGFLVARSLVQRKSGVEFLWARLLRIYPALIAMIVLCVLVVAPAFGTLGFYDLLFAHGTRHFVFQNLTLVRGVELTLPGLFENAPWKGIVNGSLWTMTYELRLYLSLVGLWWLLRPFPRLRPKLFMASCTAIALLALVWYARTLTVGQTDKVGLIDPVPRLVLMFYAGTAWWIFSGKVILDGRLLLASGAVLAAARLAGAETLFHLLFALWLPYAVWWLAFVPAGAIRGFNRIGDCSYGLYIYAFPLQQIWAISFPGAGPWAMVAGAGTATVLLGFLSWHLLEKRALTHKNLPGRFFPHLAGR